MKIEYIILLIVWVLSLTSVLGIGYALGGSPESISGDSVTNGLTLFIAISNVISSLAAVGTMLVVILARNDWLKPKTQDVTLNLKLAVQAWEASRVQLNHAVYDGGYGFQSARADDDEAVQLHLDNLKYHTDNEREHWTQISLLIEKYRFFFPSRNVEQIERFQKMRESLCIDTVVFLHSVENSVNSIHDLRLVKREKSIEYSNFDKVVNDFKSRLEPGN
ncbi:hypothetical protein [Vibrio vulnificus]|uniref:hypothetical protein n=1 Tax=Vibrio vulnificus TaxID=672 RepID=UPI001028AA56|nr:hypothetical protein [Vibrio vulnificus]EGQ8024362.1 hypothetical protein [Vibrio vulnificus]EIO3971415.1 hypothetical protein [Vibrio vulnificus]EIV8497651.1 hypothetical protein [Vibrio vulnificus]ELV8675504.1 hypothetical protein [Vibrio vulnificus]MCA3945428.1 hypothetical protein [Vibrio vulnificus]